MYPRPAENRKPVRCRTVNCKLKHHIILHCWVKESDHTATQPEQLVVQLQILPFQKPVWGPFLLLLRVGTETLARRMHY